MPFSLQNQPYSTQYTPQNLGVIQHGLEGRQQRADVANASWAETKNQLYQDPTYDPKVKEEVVKTIEGNFDNIYKEYSGDMSQAAGSLIDLIGSSRKNDYFRLNKTALEEQKKYEALKQAYGAKGLEFKGMKQGLKDENGQWRKPEDFKAEVIQDLERDEKLASIIEQSLEEVSREGGLQKGDYEGMLKRITTKGKGYLQGKGEKYDKTGSIYEEYAKTPEGQLHLRILKDLKGSKNPEADLQEYVTNAVKNRIAPLSYSTDDMNAPVPHAGSGNKTQRPDGVTFNSLGQAMVQHPDLNGIKDASDLSTAIEKTPNSIPINKLFTKITTSPEYVAEQKKTNFNARNVWSYAKSKFGDKINVNDFPELSKTINDPNAVVNSKLLNRELITLSDVFENGLSEIQKAKDIEGKFTASKNMPAIGIPGATTLMYANYASDKLAYDTDRDIRATVAKSTGFKRSDPAIKAIQEMLHSSTRLDNTVNDLLKKPENQPGRAVTMHMADELNTSGDTKQNAINKSFNAALPNYMLNAIDEGLLISEDGEPANKNDIGKLVGKLEASNMGLSYDDYGNIHFVVTGRDDKGVKQKVYSFNQQGQNSDVANTMMQQLDEFSGGKITKLRNAKFDPIEGTSYLLDRQTGNQKIPLKSGFKISTQVGNGGYTLEKNGTKINYLDYTGAKTDDDKLAVYLANFPGRPLQSTTKAGMVKEAEQFLKSLPVEFETGDDILEYTNSF